MAQVCCFPSPSSFTLKMWTFYPLTFNAYPANVNLLFIVEEVTMASFVVKIIDHLWQRRHQLDDSPIPEGNNTELYDSSSTDDSKAAFGRES